ncbi:MAG: WHG domain-containing protein, partial [Alphaproteobacteria bacterium]|nr:WHG domain-containing protein [Alphaproteobacteria bacterium]
GRMLDRLDLALKAVPLTECPRQRIKNIAMAYLNFTHDNPKLWNLLFEHHMQPGATIPPWYQEKLENLLAEVEGELGRLQPEAASAPLKRAARVLWAGVHGITSLSTTDKLSIVTTDAAAPLVEDLIDRYLDGLAGKRV